MVVLSDVDIKERLQKDLIIEGVKDEHITGSTVDLTLDNKFRIFKNVHTTHLDTKHIDLNNFTEIIEKTDEEPFIIHPGEFVLGSIRERIKVPESLMARLDGKSSLGRLGIVVHSTAGNVDPGWDGKLTLEISNISRMPVALWPGTKVAQILFMELKTPSSTPYRKLPGKEWNQPLGSKGSV